MYWHSIILAAIVIIGGFLHLGAIIIGIANSPAVLISGGIEHRNEFRYHLGTFFALIFQSLVAITLSALLISYTRFATDGKFVLLWILGIIAAIQPMWQTWRLARYERKVEPESYIVKIATHRAVPFSLILTIIFTFIFVFRPDVLNAMFYWLLWASGGLAVLSIISVFISLRNARRQNQETVLTDEDWEVIQKG